MTQIRNKSFNPSTVLMGNNKIYCFNRIIVYELFFSFFSFTRAHTAAARTDDIGSIQLTKNFSWNLHLVHGHILVFRFNSAFQPQGQQRLPEHLILIPFAWSLSICITDFFQSSNLSCRGKIRASHSNLKNPQIKHHNDTHGPEMS